MELVLEQSKSNGGGHKQQEQVEPVMSGLEWKLTPQRGGLGGIWHQADCKRKPEWQKPSVFLDAGIHKCLLHPGAGYVIHDASSLETRTVRMRRRDEPVSARSAQIGRA